MKLTIENTDQIMQLVTPTGTIPARLWIGETQRGVYVQVLVTRIAVSMDQDQSEFERELEETRAPVVQDLAFPLRMVL